ncbi:hypothetical protein [Actinomycetospora sp. NBRC 106378]|uniref:hypothetical protein n=1 Tax=Actinomycetospora sp. NBRC 106378 TaxID=3032208 RepID=UPI0025571EAD|nr:hypothetical protein [Actinomycetospora sp. NBRC 106378]
MPAWAEPGATGAWTPSSEPSGSSASSSSSSSSSESFPDVEPLVPFGAALPFEPDPEAAAFLNAPRRPLAFYVAPFGTPPFGNPPPARPSLAGPVGGPLGGAPEWGPAYPAGA